MYIEEKFKGKGDLIDQNARLNVKGLIKTLAAFKCYYRVNAYGELDIVQNKSNKSKEYPQYS